MAGGSVGVGGRAAAAGAFRRCLCVVPLGAISDAVPTESVAAAAAGAHPMLETASRPVIADGMTLNMVPEPETKPSGGRQRPRKKLSFRDPEIVGRDKYRQAREPAERAEGRADRSIIKARSEADGWRADTPPSPARRTAAPAAAEEQRFLDVIANDAVVGAASLEDVCLEVRRAVESQLQPADQPGRRLSVPSSVGRD